MNSKNLSSKDDKNINDKASDTSEQKNFDTTIHIDAVETQEEVEQKVQITNNVLRLDENVVKTILGPPLLSVYTKPKDVLNNIDTTDSPDRKKHTILVNFFGSQQPQQSTRNTNKLWLQNQPKPEKQTWSEWWQGKQYPDDVVGPINYTPKTRNSFVRLVLIIVLVMLLATAGFLAYVWSSPNVKEFFQKISPFIIMIPALIVLMTVSYSMVFYPCTRQMPCNVILLIITVMCMSMVTARITVHFNVDVMLFACLSTSAVVMVCLFLACTNFDFTSWFLYLVVIMTAFSVVVIIVVVMIAMGIVIKALIITILAISTLLQSVALTIQLQMILGGKAIELSEDDYALGAFMLYTSIVDIFLKMVQIIGLSSE